MKSRVQSRMTKRSVDQVAELKSKSTVIQRVGKFRMKRRQPWEMKVTC